MKDILPLDENLLKEYEVKNCIIASVVEELSLVLKEACDRAFGINTFIYTSSFDCKMPIKVSSPDQVGTDRLVNAFGAKNKYPLPLIVVDIGTATTFDIVSKQGEFIGGIIMPGIRLQLASLNANTSKLPLVEIEPSKQVIGDSTKNAILSGVVRGTASAIEGLVTQCEKELGEKATVIATGGYSEIISQYTKRFDYIDATLTLEGLASLLELYLEYV